MDLFNILKQFKNIAPDEGFTKKSRGLILRKHGALPGFLSILKNSLEVGASLALAGLMVFVILGGLASVRFLAPLEITALDPASIKAEAEAIDIQVELANLDYKEASQPASNKESTVSSAPSGDATKEKQKEGAAPKNNQDLSIDEALKLLSN